eukprot:gnl/MRDRNA2_/MRDRNA2_28044_c0_seq1.p1 gnl/MRDRNA2_/MRDRNA2_28044_c0~~gnl/MRDRNA2_/MRDRNA2_28044_c0_seq1.p1  ORF type:complete len:221 (+),score=12.02 gnl/MRDRNA2_/MRDRNA2_28044_c0_seq1:109-771(+)
MGSCCAPRDQPIVIDAIPPNLSTCGRLSERGPVVKSPWGVPCIDEFEVKLGPQWSRMPSHSEGDEQLMLLPQHHLHHTSQAHRSVPEAILPARARSDELRRSPSTDPHKVCCTTTNDDAGNHGVRSGRSQNTSASRSLARTSDFVTGGLPRARSIGVRSLSGARSVCANSETPSRTADLVIGRRLRDDETSHLPTSFKKTFPLVPGQARKNEFTVSFGGG